MGAVLVTGGAGYIGSFIARALRESGRPHVVLDDLSAGHERSLGGSPFVRGSLADAPALRGLLRAHDVEWIIHMAAHSLVGESMTDPAKYWRNNLGGSLALLEAARECGVRGFVLSSTAAVYGEPERVPIEEDHPTRPTNVYGETKLAVERLLAALHRAHGFPSVSLRYFNAAGASSDPAAPPLGEDHTPETHLIPLVLGAAAGTRPPVTVMGDDYPTLDGTGVRDYIHVEDLADAHLKALGLLESGQAAAEVFNLGGGEGRSVREVIDTAARVTGKPVPHSTGPRRAGDPAVLVASSERARRRLGWTAPRSSLASIVESAWRWHKDRPGGTRA
jgi:UDP-glucose 4-epimerase